MTKKQSEQIAELFIRQELLWSKMKTLESRLGAIDGIEVSPLMEVMDLDRGPDGRVHEPIETVA